MSCFNPITKHLGDQKSLRKAINAFCYKCQGGDEEDTRTRVSILESVRCCESTDCSLRPVRPVTHASEVSNDG